MSSLENGLRILALVSEERPVLRVGEVCRELDLPKASVSRLLKTLAEAGLLEREDRDQSYAAGGKALELASCYLARHSLLDLVKEAVDDLVREFGFTGHAGIVAGHERVLLAAQQGSYALQHTGSIAERKPAFDSIIGRAILARLNDAQALAQLKAGSDRGVLGGMSDAQVKAELAEIRRTRIARSSSLITPGISSIGAAVADPGRNEIMGFCLSFPTIAADAATQDRIAASVMHHAKAIGARMRDPVWTS
ncbi:IclR family transcriptional regulator [Bosea psychrotolerans]|uniref:IclR family transcriptional regulator n=1 Tax=Bosea psychrotolerans TaxID=1871628 RepID=A0A2S4MCL4_9HYPH|nr:IclR family transcriptional regulator [Bosea psychrotolerans]POR52454.1 IclR family transcriptional regulator [Bosea psychrotolerans]